MNELQIAIITGGAIALASVLATSIFAWLMHKRSSSHQRPQKERVSYLQGYDPADASSRLSFFQEAMLQWDKAVGVMWADVLKKHRTISEVKEWLAKNKIYLGKDLSRQFSQSLTAIEIHALIDKEKRQKSRNNEEADKRRKRLRENWEEIFKTEQAIYTASVLPTFAATQASDS